MKITLTFLSMFTAFAAFAAEPPGTTTPTPAPAPVHDLGTQPAMPAVATVPPVATLHGTTPLATANALAGDPRLMAAIAASLTASREVPEIKKADGELRAAQEAVATSPGKADARTKLQHAQLKLERELLKRASARDTEVRALIGQRLEEINRQLGDSTTSATKPVVLPLPTNDGPQAK